MVKLPADVGVVVLGPYPPPEKVNVPPDSASDETSEPTPVERVKVIAEPAVPLLLSAVMVIAFGLTVIFTVPVALEYVTESVGANVTESVWVPGIKITPVVGE